MLLAKSEAAPELKKDALAVCANIDTINAFEVCCGHFCLFLKTDADKINHDRKKKYMKANKQIMFTRSHAWKRMRGGKYSNKPGYPPLLKRIRLPS